MNNNKLLITIGIVVGLIFLGGTYTAFTVNNKNLHAIAKNPNPPEILENYTSNEVWGKIYPTQWESYRKGLQSDTKTKYGGNARESKLDLFPYLKTFYAGLGYSEEFWEPRGHPYAVDDIKSVPGSRKKTGGACLTCKSPQVPDLIEKYGDDFYTAPFDEMVEHVTDPIGCYDCHDKETNELRISRPALIKAFERQGKDITQASQNEMRSLVCAQCHVTYYFLDETKETTFPWDEGLKADEIYEYYQKKEYTEWEHPITQAGLVKARHPDYELFVGSTHHAAGISCADCHMPYVKEGDAKATSHWWVSPLLTIEESCSQCHPQGGEYLRNRVYDIQDQHAELLDLAEKALIGAVESIEAAVNNPNVEQELLKQAQETYRKAFWYFDYISTANSVGFHNPQEAAKVLGFSIQYANEAIQAAKDAIR
ncbi:MAG: ammonia-forming cytochrome c nitrite reductase subunit c552 [Peptococcales bacterium]